VSIILLCNSDQMGMKTILSEVEALLVGWDRSPLLHIITAAFL